MTDPAALHLTWCATSPAVGIPLGPCDCGAAAHTPDVDALVATVEAALEHLRYSNAQPTLSKAWDAKKARAALSDLAATARGTVDADDSAQLWRDASEHNRKRAEAAEADRDRLREELDHLKSEFNYESWRGDHLVYEREWQAFDAWQRGEGDRLARRVAELEAALRPFARVPWTHPEWNYILAARAALAGDGGGA